MSYRSKPLLIHDRFWERCWREKGFFPTRKEECFVNAVNEVVWEDICGDLAEFRGLVRRAFDSVGEFSMKAYSEAVEAELGKDGKEMPKARIKSRYAELMGLAGELEEL